VTRKRKASGKKPSKYGAEHRRQRAAWARYVKMGSASCWRCGKHLDPGGKWHLGHLPDGTTTKPECTACNLRDGGRRRAAQLYGKTAVSPSSKQPKAATPYPDDSNTVTRWSRHWAGPFDERCPACRELGHACPDADPGGPVGAGH
jgi:hypothetical protein